MGAHQPVSIGSGSWIGHRAMILPGSRIGRNVVVGAGSVVRGEIPDHAVVAGIPARVLRTFDPGVGWVNGSGDIRPILTTAELQRRLTAGTPHTPKRQRETPPNHDPE